MRVPWDAAHGGVACSSSGSGSDAGSLGCCTWRRSPLLPTTRADDIWRACYLPATCLPSACHLPAICLPPACHLLATCPPGCTAEVERGAWGRGDHDGANRSPPGKDARWDGDNDTLSGASAGIEPGGVCQPVSSRVVCVSAGIQPGGVRQPVSSRVVCVSAGIQPGGVCLLHTGASHWCDTATPDVATADTRSPDMGHS
jgi:hypothetical protein